MPSETSNVGGLQIPLPSEGAGTPVKDPVVLGLLDFFRFYIRDGLTAKLQDINALIPDPLPSANVFPYNPLPNWTRNAVPALYVWWEGRSQRRERSILYEMRERPLRVMYVFADITTPSGGKPYAGVPAAVDAILHKASERGRHPSYSYNGGPAGMQVSQSLGILGWRYDGGEVGVLEPVPGIASDVAGGVAGGSVIRSFPALLGVCTVWERVEQATLDVADQSYDLPFSIKVNDASDERGPVEVMQRYLVPPAYDGDNDSEEQ